MEFFLLLSLCFSIGSGSLGRPTRPWSRSKSRTPTQIVYTSTFTPTASDQTASSGAGDSSESGTTSGIPQNYLNIIYIASAVVVAATIVIVVVKIVKRKKSTPNCGQTVLIDSAMVRGDVAAFPSVNGIFDSTIPVIQTLAYQYTTPQEGTNPYNHV